MLDELACMAIAEKVVDSLGDIEAEAAAVGRGSEHKEREYKIEAVARTIFEAAERVSRNDRVFQMARMAE